MGGDKMDCSDCYSAFFLAVDLKLLPLRVIYGVYLSELIILWTEFCSNLFGLRMFLSGFVIVVSNIFCLSPENFF